MRPPAQDNVKRVKAITSLRSGHLNDHSLEDLVDVLVEFSPSLSPPCLCNNDSTLGMLLVATQLILPLPDIWT